MFIANSDTFYLNYFILLLCGTAPRKIEQAWYESVRETVVGEQPILGLQLCAMARPEEGYYPILHEVQFK